jgi:hypothetical protein
MKQLAPWILLVALATVATWTLIFTGPARAEEAVCLPPTIPPFSALQPVAFRVALFSQQGPTGNVFPIKIQQVRYVDRESREYVFSWYRTGGPTPTPPDVNQDPQPILLGVDDDPDGPTPAWYDSGAATPSGHVRPEPQQACVWMRFRRGGDLQS